MQSSRRPPAKSWGKKQGAVTLTLASMLLGSNLARITAPVPALPSSSQRGNHWASWPPACKDSQLTKAGPSQLRATGNFRTAVCSPSSHHLKWQRRRMLEDLCLRARKGSSRTFLSSSWGSMKDLREELVLPIMGMGWRNTALKWLLRPYFMTRPRETWNTHIGSIICAQALIERHSVY